ncbi:MAG: methyltransferase domain-containing protein [Betaproteobacteria bacterium]
MSNKTFRELEHQGWLAKAAVYRDIFGKITEQAIDPILDTFGDLSGRRLLDVACGTGELTVAAAERGASSEGIDFAATMIEKAMGKYPDLRFSEGDAEQLPYRDSTFDGVVCAFGLLHLQNPDGAIADARRVLKAGGRYTFTVWCSPDQGGDFFKLVMGAVQRYGTLDVRLPPAPPIFRFSDFEECHRALSTAGFTAPSVGIRQLRWRTKDPHDVLDLIYRSVVRIPMILQAQTDEARERIHRAIVEGAESYRQDGAIDLRFPAVLATAIAG